MRFRVPINEVEKLQAIVDSRPLRPQEITFHLNTLKLSSRHIDMVSAKAIIQLLQTIDELKGK